jgi:hypothetical protein
MLDAGVKHAMLDAARTLHGGKSIEALDEYLKVAGEAIGRVIGASKEDGICYFYSMQDTIATEFAIPRYRVSNPTPFLRTFYREGVYHSNYISWMVLLSFLKHAGVGGIDLDVYYNEFRRLTKESMQE